MTNLKTGEVTGAQLRKFLEKELNNVFAKNPADRFGGWNPRPSGLKMTFKAKADYGEPLDDNKTYTMTACERQGEPMSTLCRMPNAKNTKVHQINAHEAVRKYLRDRDYIESELEGRVIGLDIPRVLRTQN